MKVQSQEVRCEANTLGARAGGKEVTDVRVTGKEESPDFSPLAINHHFTNVTNQRWYSLAFRMTVCGVRGRHVVHIPSSFTK